MLDPIDYKFGPKSTASGDLNNDTCLNIVVADFISENIAIYVEYDNGTMRNPIKYSTGLSSISYMIAVDDFNNNSCLHISGANFGLGHLKLLLLTMVRRVKVPFMDMEMEASEIPTTTSQVRIFCH